MVIFRNIPFSIGDFGKNFSVVYRSIKVQTLPSYSCYNGPRLLKKNLKQAFNISSNESLVDLGTNLLRKKYVLGWKKANFAVNKSLLQNYKIFLLLVRNSTFDFVDIFLTNSTVRVFSKVCVKINDMFSVL